MPFVVAFLGIMLLAIGLRGRAGDAGKLLASEFTGPNSFIQWFLAVMILGLLGYFKPVRPFADAMLGLVILAIILTKGNPSNAQGGFFKQLENAFQNTVGLPSKPLTGPQSAAVNAPLAPVAQAIAPPNPGNPSAPENAPSAFATSNLMSFAL